MADIDEKLDEISLVMVRNTVALENVAATLKKHDKTLYDPSTGVATRMTIVETQRGDDEKSFKTNMTVAKALGGTGVLGFIMAGWQAIFKGG